MLFLSYLDADARTMSFLHAFANAESMDLHFAGADERSRAAYQYVEPLGWEVYGNPSSAALETLRQAATPPEYAWRIIRSTWPDSFASSRSNRKAADWCALGDRAQTPTA